MVEGDVDVIQEGDDDKIVDQFVNSDNPEITNQEKMVTVTEESMDTSLVSDIDQRSTIGEIKNSEV